MRGHLLAAHRANGRKAHRLGQTRERVGRHEQAVHGRVLLQVARDVEHGAVGDASHAIDERRPGVDALAHAKRTREQVLARVELAELRQQRRVLLIPIYDGVRASGTNAVYHLAGFASFVLTGYGQSGFSAASWLTGRQACTGSLRCLSGYFTRGLVPTTGAEIGGPDLGTSIVNLVG